MRAFKVVLAAVAAMGVFAARADGSASRFLWAELIAFDNASPDHGVAEYLSRMPFKPKAISFLLFDPDIIHSHTDLSKDFRIGDFHCAYNARPYSPERNRQPWTAWQLRSLVAELKRHGVDAYASVFDMAPGPSPDLARRGIVRKERTWLDGHPEVGYQLKDGRKVSNVCLIKRLADGTFYDDFFTGRLVRFLKDYGFAGFHAADGYGHPRFPLNRGDFSDDVVGQFRSACPGLEVPSGDVPSRADWILGHARLAWCRFYARRHAESFAKMARALHGEGLSLYLNSCWTRDPHEALYRYGVDFRLLEKAGIDGLFVESSVAGLEIEGWRYSDVSVLDVRRATYLRLAGATDLPLVRLCCVKDDLEQFSALRHSPMRTQGEILGLGVTCRGDRFAAPDVTWSLADAVRPEEWRQVDRDCNLLPAVASADGVRVVWSSRAADAELEAACDGRWPSSNTLLSRLLHHGAGVVSAVTVEEALADESLPLLVLNPARFPEDEIAALRRRKAAVIEFGCGAEGCSFSDPPAEKEPDSWLHPLPERTLPADAYRRAVAAINDVCGVRPDAGMDDLRLATYRTADGSRVILAINDRATYLESRLIVKGRVDEVRILTESPFMPVEIERLGDGMSRLHAKIPPAGVILLQCRERLVARPDYDAAALRPQVVRGRDYWSLLNSHVFSDPGRQLPPADERTGLADLPLFRDCALVYPFYGVAPKEPGVATWRTLPENVGGTNVPMWVALERNLKRNAPIFVRFGAKRCVETYVGKVELDLDEYRDWAARHPNFLGFVAHDEWLNDVYNNERQLPSLDAELAGRLRAGFYDLFPKTRQGYMDRARAYYDHQWAKYYGAVNSPTVALRGCYCADHIAAAWGSKAIGLETTNSTGSGDGEFRWDEMGFFVRGAARQFGIPWCWFLAIYMNGYDRTGKWISDNVCMNPPFGTGAIRPDGGLSPSLFNRAAFYAYLNGANFVEPEHWYQHLLTTNGTGACVLSDRGRLFSSFHDFTKAHPGRGTPYAPVAVLTPFDLGRNPWGGFNWRDDTIGYRPGDHMVDGIFFTLIPGFDRAGGVKEAREFNLHNTPFAMMHDVLVPDSPQDPAAFLERLCCYPVAILAGEYRDVGSFWPNLDRYVKRGGTLIVNRANVPAGTLAKLSGTTGSDVLDGWGKRIATAYDVGKGRLVVSVSAWMTPEIGEPYRAVGELISGKRAFPEWECILKRLQAELFPFEVKGCCQFGANRTERGWWLWALNNDGVRKYANAPQIVDPSQAHSIEVDLKSAGKGVRTVRELITGRTVIVRNGRFRWTIPAGEPAIFSIECREATVQAIAVPGKGDDWLQEAVDGMASCGGGVVRVPPGEWEFRPVVLKDDVTLRLDRGAILLASTNRSDYVKRDGSPVLIGAFDAKNVAVEGEGIIDGRGFAFKDPEGLAGESQPQEVPVLMRFSRCRNVRLEDFTFRQAAAWGIHLRNSDGVTVRRVKAFSHINNSNDGIDVESRNVLIEDCELDTDDDALVIKSESDPSFDIYNVEVRNCTFRSCCNAIKFGTGSYGLWRDVDIHDCRVERATRSWRFDWRKPSREFPVPCDLFPKAMPGVTNVITGLAAIALEVVDGGRMEDVKVRNIDIRDGVQTPIFVRLGRRHTPRADMESYLRNVLIENVRGVAEGRIACSITGVPGLRPQNITLRNVDLTFPGGGTKEDAAKMPRECEADYPDCYMFDQDPLPAWGFFIRHADDIRFENVRLELETPDARQRLVTQDVKGFSWK